MKTEPLSPELAELDFSLHQRSIGAPPRTLRARVLAAVSAELDPARPIPRPHCAGGGAWAAVAAAAIIAVTLCATWGTQSEFTEPSVSGHLPSLSDLQMVRRLEMQQTGMRP